MLDKRPLLHLLNCKVAFEMWNKIKAFERDNGLTYEKGIEIVTYISKLRNLAIESNGNRNK